MATTPPQLGYGQRTEAPINAVNVWMRGQPWYQQLLSSWGQNPNNVHLNDAQKQQVVRAAQANGVVVDEGHDGQEVDDSGNFQAKGHGLRNTLLVAGIAAASLATMGAAGVFSGAAGAAGAGGAAGGGAAAAAGGGTLASAVGVGGAAGAAGAGAGFFTPALAGTLASTAAGAFANIYSANKQADAARYGVDAQTAAANHAADLQDEAAKRAEAFSRQQAETGWQSGEHTNKANYDQWAARQHAIMGSLGQQLGINYTPPEYSAGIDPHFTDAAAPAAGASTPATSGQPGAAEMKALLESGIDPQAAVSQFNQKYGRTTGNEAVYYDPSQHGGVATIGLPDAYLAKPGASWDVTQRQGGNGSSAAPAPRQTLATFVSPKFLPFQSAAPVPTPYQPGTLGAYVGGY